MLAQPLDFTPGERYAYSNYGYCLLGRVIEAVTGQPYESYVKQHVLAPWGIRTMRIGQSRPSDAGPRPARHCQTSRGPCCESRSGLDKARYYDPGTGPSVHADQLGCPVPQPYGAWHLAAMDAHGGWLASAVDLARFACAVDGHGPSCRLGRQSVELMFRRPVGLAGQDGHGQPAATYYSCGWMNRVVAEGKFNRWHAGMLPGTTAILVLRHDGRNWAVLCNASVGSAGASLVEALDPLMHQAADEVIQWPDLDLFGEFVQQAGM